MLWPARGDCIVLLSAKELQGRSTTARRSRENPNRAEAVPRRGRAHERN